MNKSLKELILGKVKQHNFFHEVETTMSKTNDYDAESLTVSILKELEGKVVMLSDVTEGNLYSVLTKYFPTGVDASIVNKCARAIKIFLVSKAVKEV